MAAVLSSDKDKTDKVVTLIDEARRMGLKVEPPDVNSSHYMFTVSGERSIRYGLGAIKGVGQSVVEMLVAEREAHGAFRDLADLCRRSDAEPHEPSRARSADPLRRARPARRESRDADARTAHRRCNWQTRRFARESSARTTCSA